MKKFTSWLLVSVLAVCSAVCLCGCNFTKAGRLEEIAGIYHMTTFTKTEKYNARWESVTEPGEIKDYLAEGYDKYVLISKAGYGFIATKTSDSDWQCKICVQIYTYDTDDDNNPTDKISRIVMKDGKGEETNLYVHHTKKKSTFTDNSGAFRLKIFGSYTGKRYSTDITYTRVSKKEGISDLRAIVNNDLPYANFNDYKFGGYYASYSPTQTEYLYDYYYIDPLDMTKATHYYADLSKTAHSEEVEMELLGNTLTLNGVDYVVETTDTAVLNIQRNFTIGDEETFESLSCTYTDRASFEEFLQTVLAEDPE